MFYFNARWAFKLPDACSEQIPGGIIAASAVQKHTLLRRSLGRFPHLQHRLFDPQLYLSELSPDRSPHAITRLATYGWFPAPDVPEYDSAIHGRQADWTAQFEARMLAAWRGAPVEDEGEIDSAVKAAIEFQVQLGCDAVILPSPLTRVPAEGYEPELRWLDRGLAAREEMRIHRPVFATVALSDVVLRGLDPQTNPLLSLVSDHVSARSVDGVYLVIEQASEEGYCCGDENTLFAVLTLVDDFVRGANLRVAINYMGTFGAVASAAGAEIWSSGYYKGQRRLRLSEFEIEDEDIRFAYPRYYSLGMAGDIGIQHDLARIIAGGARVQSNTAASKPLHDALARGVPIDQIPAWRYSPSNVQAAAAHYIDLMARMGTFLDRLESSARADAVSAWLQHANHLAAQVRALGIRRSARTETTHQAAWLRAFNRWRAVAGV